MMWQRDQGMQVAYLHSGNVGFVFHSLSDQRCTICGKIIPQGALFTKRALSFTGTVFVICAQCQPFRQLEEAQAVQLDVRAG